MFTELGLNVARQPDNGANPRPDNRSGWLDGEPPRTPVDDLIDSQDEADFWDPSTQLRVVKKKGKAARLPAPGEPRSGRVSSGAGAAAGSPSTRGDRRRAAGGDPRGRAAAADADGRLGAGAADRARRPATCCCSAPTTTWGSPTIRLVSAAAIDATERWGTGAGASRLVSGNMEPHERLERRLAAFHGTESALLFGSGYLANTGDRRRARPPRRRRLLRRAQPRQHHRRLPPRRRRDVRLPPSRPRAPRLGARAAARATPG